MKTKFKCISVIGSANATNVEWKIAEKVGALLGKQNVVVICGGRSGVMEAVCKGAQAAGGITIGILPGIDPNSGNQYLSLSIPTGLGEARNPLVVQSGESIIAIGGGYGTLSEIAFALKLGRKVIGINTWDADNGDPIAIQRVDTAEDAVDLALSDG
jgi:uncharacterized protein (TIGR00725 family)